MGLILFAAPFTVKPQNSDFRPFLGALRPRRKMKRGMWSKSLIRTTITLLHNRCDAVIALSEKKQRQLKLWHTQTPVKLIPTGVDKIPCPKNGGKKFREKYDIKQREKVVLFVGRIAPEKNIQLLVKAFRRLRQQNSNVKLMIVGDGENKQYLMDLVQKFNLQDYVIFTGSLDRSELGCVYEAANVFAFPSRTDTQGLVLHEAAHAGLPLVMTDKKVSEMLIPGETGVFAENSIVGMAEALDKVIKMPKSKYEKMSQNAKIQARRYGEHRQTKKNEILFKNILEKNNKTK
jgi:glycosyltransferase involved in cell wall biosynthesis